MPSTLQRVTLSARPADWTDTLVFQQIDPALGITSLSLGITATLDNQVSVESLEAAPSTFTSSETAVVAIRRPDLSTLLDAGPTTTLTAALAAFDGVKDGAGASGLNLSTAVSAGNRVTYVAGTPASPDAGLFIGTGTLTLPVTATARVTASGPGNLSAMFRSTIAAEATLDAQTGTPDTGGGPTVGGGSQTVSPPPFFPLGTTYSPVQTRVIPPGMTGASADLMLDGFDPAIGTLIGVNVSITIDSTGSVGVENLDPVAAFIGVRQTASASLLSAAGAALATASASASTGQQLAAFDGTVDEAGRSGLTTATSASGRDVSTLVSAADLAGFVATGALTLRGATAGLASIDGPGNLAVDTGLQAGATISVGYAYTANPLVDRAYYLNHNPDVAAASMDPAAHYARFGWHEGRNPDALFDTNYYLTHNPDVKAAGFNPLAHFENSGWRENRDPSLLFSDAKYLAAYPDVRAAGLDPLLHYVRFGQHEGRMTFLSGGSAAADPLVDTAYYDRQLGATLLPTGAAGAQQAAWSYDATGWQQGLNPDAFFDTSYYLAHNPDVAAAHINPLAHYEATGWREGRDASAQFSTGKYLAAYGDVRAAGINPLLHYVNNGQAEGRTAFAA